ncbi:MAG TPA: hypothetical protein VM511_04720 [Luteolibacter sp.]|nr:hypothetical protein [Luteolibacter sp.]
MATIEIRSWGDFIGGTAWDSNPEAELKQRMRRAVELPQSELRALARRIRERETFTIPRVREEGVLGIIQILGAMGAETVVQTDSFTNPRLFEKWPKR